MVLLHHNTRALPATPSNACGRSVAACASPGHAILQAHVTVGWFLVNSTWFSSSSRLLPRSAGYRPGCTGCAHYHTPPTFSLHSGSLVLPRAAHARCQRSYPPACACTYLALLLHTTLRYCLPTASTAFCHHLHLLFLLLPGSPATYLFYTQERHRRAYSAVASGMSKPPVRVIMPGCSVL